MNTPVRGGKRPLQAALALALALGSNAAMALGLGDIRVLSQPGQPLLAEIPVVSADPGELEAARVALASPATFARVGLERPSGLVSALAFDFAQDAQGRAVIRVSSPMPVDVPVVSFLIEVDWGRGRLVREYSALVDGPQTATAIQAPQIQAPSQAPSNTIVREPAVAPAVPATPLAAVPAPAPAPAASASPVRAPAPAAPPVTAADGALTVQSGQTLSQIAGQLARGSQASLDQAMVALLQANPQAFIGGNIHRLRAGAQLQLPDAQALASVGAAQARALVREQTGQWQQARAPMPQPALADAASAGQAAPAQATDNTPATTGARLEIAPAATADGAAAARISGTEAGAEGDRLVSEQLRQAHEDLATRDAEVAELRERVAELEKLREQQSALIALKDNEMAAAQKQVAAANDPAASGSGAAWAWGGGLLLLGAAVAAWLARRRKPSPLPPLAAGGALAVQSVEDEPGPHEPEVQAPVHPAALDADQMIAMLRSGHGEPVLPAGPEAGESLSTVPETAEPVAAADAEPVARGEVAGQAPARADDEAFDLFQLPDHERADAPEAEPQAAAAMPWGVDVDIAHSSGLPQPGSRERLELAIAYLDLGDADTARNLLQEVVTGADAAAREQALELLGRLG